MKNRSKRVMIAVLGVLGALMMVFSAIELSKTPDALQYCALPSAQPEDGAALAKKRERLRTALEQSTSDVAFCAVQGPQTLQGVGRSAEATVYAVGEGWFEIYPRFLIHGRRINETELREGGRVMMMDERLAFQLFGDPLPEKMRLKLWDQNYRVVGTVRHAGSLLGGEGVGDQQPYDIYVPLATALKDGFKPAVEMLSAKPVSSTGVEPQFINAARSVWRPDGESINLRKEAMRVTMLPRIVFLFFGLYLFALIIQAANRFCTWLRAGYKSALTHAYFRSIWPRFIGMVALHILCYSALIGAISLLVVFSAQPIPIFTEWVPENIVSWSSITKVFWNLTRSAAGLVRIGSREMRIIAFWGGMLRWGTVLLLVASSMAKSRFGPIKINRKNPRKEQSGI